MGTLTPPTTEATGVRLEGGTRDAPTPQRAPLFCGGENPCLKNPTYILAYIMEGLVAGGEGGRGNGRTREREDAGTGVTSFMGSKVSLHGVGVGIQGKGSRNGGDQPPTPAPCTPTPWLGPKPRITFSYMPLVRITIPSFQPTCYNWEPGIQISHRYVSGFGPP